MHKAGMQGELHAHMQLAFAHLSTATWQAGPAVFRRFSSMHESVLPVNESVFQMSETVPPLQSNAFMGKM